MLDRRLVIKEMWNEFNSFQPERSAGERKMREMHFYAGVIAMYNWMGDNEATPETLTQIQQEIRDFFSQCADLAASGHHA